MAGITTGPNFRLLSSGDRLYAYSGIVAGDVSVPATVQLLKFENTGLRDMFLKVSPSYGSPISNSGGAQLGIIILIDGIEVVEHNVYDVRGDMVETFELFIPKQSTFEVLSLNTSANNTQERGCTALGWYL